MRLLAVTRTALGRHLEQRGVTTLSRRDLMDMLVLRTIDFDPSSLSDLSPTDVSPAKKLVCAELSLRKGRDRLLDIFLRKKSRSAEGFLEACQPE